MISLFFVIAGSVLGVALISASWLNERTQTELGRRANQAALESLSFALAREVEAHKALLMNYSERRESQGGLSGRHEPYAFVGAFPLDSSQDGWRWIEARRENSALVQAALPLLTGERAALQELRDELIVTPLTHDSQAFVLLMYPVAVSASGSELTYFAVAALEQQEWQVWADRFRGQRTIFSLLNLEGRALAHSEGDYLGHSLRSSPFVSALSIETDLMGFQRVRSAGGDPYFVGFQRVDGAHMISLVATPLVGWSLLALVPWLLAFAALIFGAGLFYFLLDPRASTQLAVPQTPVKAPPQRTVNAAPLPEPPKLSLDEEKSLLRERDKTAVITSLTSHIVQQLQSPLASILGHAQLGLRKKEQSQEHCRKIETETRRARLLLDKLEAFTGKRKLYFKKWKMSEVMQVALQPLHGKLRSAGLPLLQEGDEDVEVEVDLEQTATAIQAVIENSIESLHGAMEKYLRVSWELEDGVLKLDIEDNGPGMEPEVRQRASEPFFTTHSNQGKKGLGLAVVSGIMREHGGDLYLAERAGGGTWVQLRLPQSQPEEAPVVARQDSDEITAMSDGELESHYPVDLPAAPPDEPTDLMAEEKSSGGAKLPAGESSTSSEDSVLLSDSTEPVLANGTQSAIDQVVDAALQSQRTEAEPLKQSWSDSFEEPILEPESEIEQGRVSDESKIANTTSKDKTSINVKKKERAIDRRPIRVRRPQARAGE